MDTSEKVSPNDILSRVLVYLDDEGYTHGITPGFYMDTVMRALESFAINSQMFVVTKDIPFPTDKLIIDLPKDCFNIRELYLHNGVCCEPGNDSVIVWWKRDYNNSQGGDGYTAMRKENQVPDPFMNPFLIQGGTNNYKNLYYANAENGLLMFGSKCNSFKYFRIVYNSMGGNIGDEPMIPRLIREAVVDKVTVDAATALCAKDKNKYVPLLQIAKNRLEGQRGGAEGSWDIALRMIRKMGGWKRRTFFEINGRLKY